MSIQLESRGLNAPNATDYSPVEVAADRLRLTFTNIQGNGSAQVYVRSGKVVRRVDTISMFDLSTYTQLVFWDFTPEDEIAVNLVGYSPDTVFRATLDIEQVTEQAPAETTNALLQLDARVTALEQAVASGGTGNGGNTGGTGNVPADVSAQLSAIRADVGGVKTTVAGLQATLTTLSGTVTSNYNALNTTITNNFNSLSTRIDNLPSSGGGGVSNVIQTVVASSGSTSKTLDASLADRFDITGDATNNFTLTNVVNSSNNERAVVVAAMSTKKSTTRNYFGVDVWLTEDNKPPVADNRPGFGELLYFTNIHGAVFGQVRKGVRFKYHTPGIDFVTSNFPLTETASPVASIVGDSTATVTNATFDTNGGLIAGAPVSTFGAIVEPTTPSNNIQSFVIWFKLAGSSSSSASQKLIAVMENGTTAGLDNLSFLIEEYTGNLYIRWRKGDNTIGNQQLMAVSPNVLYGFAARLDLSGSTQAADFHLKRMDTGVETTSTISGFTFGERRTASSRFYLMAGTDKKGNMVQGSLLRAWVTYNALLSVTHKNEILGKYL